MKTTDFYDKVMQSPTASFDKSQWQNLSDRDQRKKWSKDLSASMIYGTGLMDVVAYSNTQDDAVNLANANHADNRKPGLRICRGDVSIKTVDNPLVSRWPARPNFLLNTGIGFASEFLSQACGYPDTKNIIQH